MENQRPIIFGEVLFDVFPDKAVLGGAPFNVAWHLQGFGCAPLFISRVGNDDLGAQIRDGMASWGMDTAGVQTDETRPTGQVKIEMTGASHSFEILPDQAYDHINQEEARAALAGIDAALFYHGGLIAREEESAATLAALRSETEAPVFVDINLRTPFWTREGSLALMRGARWVKLNDEEIAQLAPNQTPEDLRATLGVERLILTRGEQGADLYSANGTKENCAPAAIDGFVDSVGAGDAFASVMILGLLKGWPAKVTMARAQAFASELCTHRGATIADQGVYDRYRKQWTQEQVAAQFDIIFTSLYN